MDFAEFREDVLIQRMLFPSSEAVGSPPYADQGKGVVLIVAWQWEGDDEEAKEARAQFAQLSSALCAAAAGDDKEVEGGEELRGLYVYPQHELHTTVATCSSFKKPQSVVSQCTNEETKREIFTVWAQALGRAFLQSMWTGGNGDDASFAIRAREVDISPDAAIVLFDDCDGGVARLRQGFRAAVKEDPAFAALEQRLGCEPGALTADLHVPNIVHSTIGRFHTVPKDHTAAWNAFKHVARREWTPVRLRARAAYLVHEYEPYMFVNRERALIAALPLHSKAALEELVADPKRLVVWGGEPSPAAAESSKPTRKEAAKTKTMMTTVGCTAWKVVKYGVLLSTGVGALGVISASVIGGVYARRMFRMLRLHPGYIVGKFLWDNWVYPLIQRVY